MINAFPNRADTFQKKPAKGPAVTTFTAVGNADLNFITTAMNTHQAGEVAHKPLTEAISVYFSVRYCPALCPVVTTEPKNLYLQCCPLEYWTARGSFSKACDAEAALT